MAQYRTGTANFTSGSQTVTGNGTLWSSNASSSDFIVKTGDLFPTVIATVVSDTQLTLNANYAGATSTASGYQITSDFTDYLNLPLIFDGDLGTPELIRDAFEKLDTQLGGGFTNPLLAPSGSAGAPGLSWSSDTDTGFSLISAGHVGLYIGGTKLIDYSDESVVVSGDITANNISKSAIDKIVASTANLVDVKIYDTTKDSDGGAWRNKTQHTSWYNEALNTATRGATSKFPEVALIVAETDTVTIYDGTKAGVPMWMVFNVGNPVSNNMITGTTALSYLTAINGTFVVGTTQGGWGISVVNFITDGALLYDANKLDKYNSDILDRNAGAGVTQISAASNLVNGTVNDIAITALSGAETDSSSEDLPFPTVLACTAAGASIINRTGTLVNENDVIDLTGAISLVSGDLDANGFVIVASSSKVYIYETMPTANIALTSADYEFGTAGTSGPHISGTITSVKLVSSDSGNAEFIVGTDEGLFIVDYVTGGTASGVSQITKDFNAPDQYGDIELCLCDSLTDRSIAGTTVTDNGTAVVAAAEAGAEFKKITATGGSITATVTTGGAIYGWEEVSGVWYFRANTGWVGVSESGGTLTIADTTVFAGLRYVNGAGPSAAKYTRYENDEKWLFRENALATLQGTSDAVADLSYDSDTGKIDAATADGTTTLVNLLPISYTDQSGTQTSDTMVAVDRVNDTVAFANAAEVAIEKPQEDL